MIVFVGLIVFVISNRQQTSRIYQEIKQDFKNFHLGENFKKKLTGEFAQFVNQIKVRARIQKKHVSAFKDKTLNFMNDKFKDYLH